jgi:hypothetical protein
MLFDIVAKLRAELPPHLRRRLNSDLEIQLTFEPNGDDKGERRIPKEGDTTEPHFNDSDHHPDDSKLIRVGTSGWDWINAKSIFFVVDVDAAANHSEGQPRERIEELIQAVQEVPQVELLRSRSGLGVHLILWEDPDRLPIASTRAEHKGNSARALRWLASRISFPLADAVDCAGVMGWLWHRECGEHGFELIKDRSAFLPEGYRDEFPSIKTSTDDRFFDQPAGEWTDEKLKALLKEHKLNTEYKNDWHHFPACPICHGTDANAAVRIWDGHGAFKCNRKQHCDKVGERKTFRDFLAMFPPPKVLTLKGIRPSRDFRKLHPHNHVPVIDGLVLQGDVVNVVSGTKGHKSFAAMQCALSVCAGLLFLGWATRQGRVLLIDDELDGTTLIQRQAMISRAMGVSEADQENLDIWMLRDEDADVDLVQIDKHLWTVTPGTYKLIIIDALYRVLPEGVNENDNADITRVYNRLARMARRQECAVLVIHHTSKGTQHQKSVTDMGSGAGAQSRAVDVHLTLRDHADPGTVVMEAALRKLPPIAPKCLKFDFPLFHVVEANPDDIATPGKKPRATIDQFLKHVPETPTAKAEVLDLAWELLTTTKSVIKKLCEAAVERGLVIEVPSRGNSPAFISLAMKGKP